MRNIDLRSFANCIVRVRGSARAGESSKLALDGLADAATRDKLKWAMSDPERLRPGESRQALTERAAATFAGLAQSLRERGDDPRAVAHFVNRPVLCMFAEDVDLLPDNIFTRMPEQARICTTARALSTRSGRAC